jgi:hypothetical protein
LFGNRFVVLYAEPVSEKGQSLTTNTARTTLLLNGQPLPWDDWAYEFREKMPKPLAAFIRDKAAAITERDHIGSIKERLKNVMDLYKVSRYRPAPTGVYLSDESSAVRVGQSPFSGARSSAAIEERFSVLLEARAEGRGQCWRGAGHSMAWTGGLVDLSFAHEIEAD